MDFLPFGSQIFGVKFCNIPPKSQIRKKMTCMNDLSDRNKTKNSLAQVSKTNFWKNFQFCYFFLIAYHNLYFYLTSSKCYFCLFTCFFSWPNMLFELRPILASLRKKWFYVLLLNLIVFMLVKYCTIVHPYNLADNRHLVFYAWKLMYKFRLALVPVYSISIFLVWETLPKVSLYY